MKDRMALLMIVNAVCGAPEERQACGFLTTTAKNGLCGACAGPYMLVVVEAMYEVR